MRRETAGYAFITVTIILWSSIEVTAKAINNGPAPIDPLELTFMRFLIGALIVRALAPVLEHPQAKNVRYPHRDYVRMALMGLVGISVTAGFIHASVVGLPACVAATVFSSNPLFVALFAFVLLGEEFSKRKLIGLLLGMVGVGVLQQTAQGELRYFVYAVIAAAGFALYIVMFKLWGASWGRVRTTYTTMGFGACFLALAILVRGGPRTPPDHWLQSVWLVLYLGVVTTGLSYVCYFEGLQRVEASRGAAFFYLKPLIATALAVNLLKESVGWRMGVGGVLVVAGLHLALIRGRARKADKEDLIGDALD